MKTFSPAVVTVSLVNSIPDGGKHLNQAVSRWECIFRFSNYPRQSDTSQLAWWVAHEFRDIMSFTWFLVSTRGIESALHQISNSRSAQQMAATVVTVNNEEAGTEGEREREGSHSSLDQLVNSLAKSRLPTLAATFVVNRNTFSISG